MNQTADRSAFLGNANALLFPIDWPEPFGLVLIEAMACGTPVIAWRCGSVSEIIDDGKTDFITDTEDEAVRAVLKLDQLDRPTVRRVFQERFTADVMHAITCAIIGGFAEQSAELTLGAVFSAPIHRYASQQSGREPKMSGKTMFDPSQCQDLLSRQTFPNARTLQRSPMM